MSSLPRLALALLSVSLFACTAVGCGSSEEDDVDVGEGQLQKGPNSDRWVYNGKLPHLEQPSIVVAQTPHTMRVTGLVPAGFDVSKLPFFAKDGMVTEESGRTRLNI